MASLKGKNIIITGGSLGIGLAVSKKCAEEGAILTIAARNKQDLANALEELKSVSDKPHQTYPLDISDIEQVYKFRDWCSNNFAVNGLVNCAGVYGPIGKTSTIDLKDFAKAININFLGTVYMCSTFSGLIKATGKKKIINYSGGGAATPFPNYSAYATSKAAVVRFTENLSLELSDEDFDINCVAPGFVITRLHNQTIDAGVNSVGKNFLDSTKRQMETGGVPPEKAADLTAFLLSEESDGITGKFISAPWDNWSDKDFQQLLKDDKDFATLRRIDNKTFYKK